MSHSPKADICVDDGQANQGTIHDWVEGASSKGHYGQWNETDRDSSVISPCQHVFRIPGSCFPLPSPALFLSSSLTLTLLLTFPLTLALPLWLSTFSLMHTSQQSSDSFHGSGATLEREQGRLHLLGPPVGAVAESCGQ